jgi:hypothetical protein
LHGLVPRPVARSSVVRLGLVAALLLPAAHALLAPAPAGAPEGDPVYILPGPGGAKDQESILVTPDLLKKLDAVARRRAPAPQGAVLVSASYEGTVADTYADLKADFLVYCAADRAVVRLPLDGVDLQEGALLEGAFVYPAALPGPRAGYAVTVTGRKGQMVRLTLPFRVRVTGTGDVRDFTFTVPPLAQSRLDVKLPAGARGAQAVTALGRQRVGADGDRVRLRASLGLADLTRKANDSAVQVRWRQPGPAARPPLVQVGEYYLWDLRRPAPELTAVLKYAVTSGTVRELSIDLPAGVEVRSVEMAPQPAVGGGAVTPSLLRLTAWKLAPRRGRNRLTLKLSEPLTGGLQLRLNLVPRLPSGPGTFALVLPTPAAPPVHREKSPPGLLAYRVGGLEAADRPEHLGVLNIPFDRFVKEWQALGWRPFADAGRGTGRAYSFRRTGPGPALEVTLAAPQPPASARVAWRVARGHADLDAEVRLSGEGAAEAEDVALVEWEVPPEVTVALVAGPDVDRVSRSGKRLQVWLREPRRQTTVRLTGWLRPPAGSAARFGLPAVRLVAPRPARAEVVLAAAPGVALEPAGPDNLRQLPGSADPCYEVVAPGRPYGLTLGVRPAKAEAEARLLTAVEARDGWARFTARVALDRPPGEPRPLELRLARWPGADVRLEAPGLTAAEARPEAGVRAWTFRLPAGGPPRYALTLTGKVRVAPGARVPVPEVRLRGAAVRGRWVAVLGGDLRVEQVRGLRRVKDAAELSRWPGEAALVHRHGSAWQAAGDDWHLGLALRPAAESSAVTVVLAEQQAAVTDGRRWLHEGAYTLLAEGSTDLHVELPEGARLAAAALDGSAAAPRQTGPRSLWLPLPAGAGVHTLRVRWRFGPEAESLGRPRLRRLRLAEGGACPVLWTVYVPPGYRLARTPGAGDAVPIGRARRELERAAALLRLVTLLAERAQGRAGAAAGGQLPAVWKRFAACRRRAEGALLADPAAGSGVGPGGRRLADWLRELRRQEAALARKHGLSRVRAEAERHPGPDGGRALTPLGDRGTPASWRTGPGDAPPAVALQPAAARARRAGLVASEFLLGLLLAVWILSHLPRLAGWLRRLWPEQLLLLALLGWEALGPSLVGAVLILVALAARLVLLAWWLHELLHRPRAVPAAGSSATSS